jgi:DNA/RNA-binding domain of Phe-tRNA-synthetase-like protein
MTVTFGYQPGLVERFPSLVAGVIHATGLINGPTPPDLVEAYVTEQQIAVDRLARQPISDIASISAWRRTFSACGVKPTQHRVAAEALLRRLDKAGDIPNINTMVDIANLVSIRYALPVAVFDQSSVTGPTTVRFADGTEQFTDLGADQPANPEPDEVIFVDDAGLVSARRWCWRQSAQSATSRTTTEALITVEGLHDTAAVDIDNALGDVSELLTRFQPGARLQSRRLDATTEWSVTFAQ